MAPVQIKALRLSNNLTQSQAAKLCYVTLRAWQAWEYGTRKMSEGSQQLFLRQLDRHCPNCGMTI